MTDRRLLAGMMFRRKEVAREIDARLEDVLAKLLKAAFPEPLMP